MLLHKQYSQAKNDSNGQDCSVKSNRNIKDQFVLRLRGTVVEPPGDAGKWLLSK